MIDASQIGIVVQGDLRAETMDCIAALRASFPGAQIVLSTFDCQTTDAQFAGVARGVDEVVISPDPGASPSTIYSATAPKNNVNRQIVSTMAGLRRLERPMALKVRSDAVITGRQMVDAWEDQVAADGRQDRLVVPSIYTRHPLGINGYLFHVSDWATFGTTDALIDYWSAALMPGEQAVWFHWHDHSADATATGRRFRSRYTQEQWICTQYAQRHGYTVPACVYESTPELIASYERLLVERFLVLDTEAAGLSVPRHAAAARSLFQRIDCVSHADWLDMADAYVRNTGPRMDPLRGLARWARRPIARGLLAKKWIKNQIGN
jgi:hypothetical protein